MLRLRSGAVALVAALVMPMLAGPPAAHAAGKKRKPKPAASKPADPGLDPVPDVPDPAEELLKEGTRLFTEEADYEGALQHFQESYRTRPSWKALSGMALVYQQQGRYVDAIDTYEQLIHDFGATLSESQMGTVRRRLEELEHKVGVVDVAIAQPDAVVYIDGHEVSRGTTHVRVRVLPGPHTLVATLERHETLTQRIDAQPGHDVPVQVRLGDERVKVVLQRQRFERPYAAWVPWATMGGGLVFGLVGGGVHYSAMQDFRRFDDKVAETVPVGGMAGQVDESLKKSGELKQTIAISLYGLGGATLATGVVLLFFNRPRPVEAASTQTTASVYFDGESFGVAGTF